MTEMTTRTDAFEDVIASWDEHRVPSRAKHPKPWQGSFDGGELRDRQVGFVPMAEHSHPRLPEHGDVARGAPLHP